MAKKNGEIIEGEAPVKKAPAKSESPYAALQADRREVEAELIAVNDQIRNAITLGDLAALEKLTARKAALPALFIAASVAETTARHEIFNAEDDANVKTLHSAEAERDRLQSAMDKLKQEYAEDLAALTEQLQAAEQAVGAASGVITASRNLGAANEDGFKRSMAALAGV